MRITVGPKNSVTGPATLGALMVVGALLKGSKEADVSQEACM